MDGGMARHTFNLKRSIYKFRNFRVRIVKPFKLRRDLKSLFNSHFKVCRNKLCNLINILIRHSEGASHIPYGRSCCHCSKSDYLSNMVGTIFSVYIIYYFLTALIAKINVKVRH